MQRVVEVSDRPSSYGVFYYSATIYCNCTLLDVRYILNIAIAFLSLMALSTFATGKVFPPKCFVMLDLRWASMPPATTHICTLMHLKSGPRVCRTVEWYCVALVGPLDDLATMHAYLVDILTTKIIGHAVLLSGKCYYPLNNSTAASRRAA